MEGENYTIDLSNYDTFDLSDLDLSGINEDLLIFYGYLMIFIFGIILNGISIIMFLFSAYRSRTGGIIPLNMAIGDFIMLLFLPLNVHRLRNENKWQFGSTACALNNSMPHIIMFVSIFLLTLLAFDRYSTMTDNSVTKFVRKYRQIDRVRYGAIAYTWIMGVVIAVPIYSRSQLLIGSDSYEYYESCGIVWGQNSTGLGGTNASNCNIINGVRIKTGSICRCGLEPAQQKFQIAVLTVTFIFPLLSMIYFYSTISMKVYRSERNVSANKRSSFHMKYRKSLKIFGITTILIIAYLICWAPYHLFYMSVLTGLSQYLSPLACEQFRSSYETLIWFNRLVNPILYTFMASDRRDTLQQWWIKCACSMKRVGESVSRPFSRRTSMRTSMENLST